MKGWPLERYWAACAAAIILPVVLVAIAAIIELHGLKVGPFEIEGTKAKAARFEKQAEAASQAATTSEQRRDQERAQAVTSYAAQAERCAVRITTARDSAAAISEIVNVEVPENGGGNRGLVPAAQLRRVIGQGPHGGAGGLSPGGDGPARD